MDSKLVDLLIKRIDQLEVKVDMLLASHWKRVGVSIVASFIFTVVFGLVVAIIEKH